MLHARTGTRASELGASSAPDRAPILRARFFAALGLPLLSACASAQSPDGVTSSGDGSSGGVATDAVAAASGATAGSTGSGSTAAWRPKTLRDKISADVWAVSQEQPPPDPNGPVGPELMHMPSCPSGNFCQSAKTIKGSEKAPDPYGECPANTQAPFDRGVSVRFSDTWTQREREDQDATACCYTWVQPCPGGRAYRAADGRAIVADVIADGATWLGARTRGELENPRDRERAAYWTEAARAEHASVASFAGLALELLALGAPARLVASAHEAALDEIRHARVAFELAEAFSGTTIGPSALEIPAPPSGERREPPFASTLRSTLRDGCIGESVAALDARARVRDARTDLERRALEIIAEDEERHAELAFAIVGWIVRVFGAPAHEVLEAELERIVHDARPAVHHVVRPCLAALQDGRA